MAVWAGSSGSAACTVVVVAAAVEQSTGPALTEQASVSNRLASASAAS